MENKQLNEIRAQIDQLDQQLADLFVQRIHFVSQAMQFKQAADLPLFDRDRELQIQSNYIRRLGSSTADHKVVELVDRILKLNHNYPESDRK